MRSIKFSSRIEKNVDYMENLKFSSWVEASSRYLSWNFHMLLQNYFKRGIYYLGEMKFYVGLTTWNFNLGWESPHNRLLNIFSADLHFDALITRVLLALTNYGSDSWRKYSLKDACWCVWGGVWSKFSVGASK